MRDAVGNDAAGQSPRATPEFDLEAAPASDGDRLWAALGHLGIFGGAWLLAPLVVYLIKRNGSPFVRWHSFQAVVLAIWTFCMSVLSGGIVLLAFVLAFILGKLGFASAAGVVVLLSFLPIFCVWAFSLLMSVVGGLRSLRGRPFTMPVVGRVARGAIDRRERHAIASPRS